MMVPHAKKNYASIIEIQEGNMVPKESQLDVKGIEAIYKSTKPLSTRKALKKILLEDILSAPSIDQLRFIKDIAILERQIVNSIKDGNMEYFKPVTIKSMNSYDDPLRIQGIKASIAWNMIKTGDLPAINLEERNAVIIVKTNINKATVEDIKDIYPEIYNNILNTLEDDSFKAYIKVPNSNKKWKNIVDEVKLGNPEYTKQYKIEVTTKEVILKRVTGNEINAIAIPLDVQLPDWIKGFIDYNSIIADNLNGFPYESIGIKRLEKNIGCTNIVEL